MDKFIVNYWHNPTGRAPVEKYIDGIKNKKERAELLSALKGIQEHGTDAVGVEFRQIEGKLWEIKIKTHGNQHRIFYVLLKSREMILLHAFLKKSSKAPAKEIQTARERMKELTGGKKDEK